MGKVLGCVIFSLFLYLGLITVTQSLPVMFIGGMAGMIGWLFIEQRLL